MNYREYQHIDRRKSPADHRRQRNGRRRRADYRADHDQHADHRRRGTVAQIRRAEAAGVDIVRVSCPDEESTAALKHIVSQVNVPVVADIHFHYKRGIEAAEAGAACLRINPGNIGSAGARARRDQGGARP